MSNKETPQINAGSMADIAFLLLIFFLVTTTMENDIGILKRLPQKQTDAGVIDVNERNVFEISINNSNELLIENTEKIDLKDLKNHLIDFIDNGAGLDVEGNPCDWCNGNKNENLSDHPAKAIITLQSARNTSYGVYIAVQNEINAAYTELRNKLSTTRYGISFTELEKSYKKSKNNTSLKEKYEFVKDKYPMLISEHTPENKS